MKGYGLPRNDDVEHPDKADQRLYGLKGMTRRQGKKRIARRIWKRLARREGKQEVADELSRHPDADD